MKLLKSFTESGSGSSKAHHQTRMMSIMLTNPRLFLEDDDAPHTEVCPGKQNTSGNESGAQEDDVPENEDPMREDALYGEP